MYGSTNGRLQKNRLQVELELDNNTVMMGYVFVSHQQRLPDLLNDDRAFLPFETMEGVVTIIRKSTVRRVTPMNQVTMPSNSSDPLEILGLTPNASFEQAKEVYLRMVQENHPDKLAAMGLPREFIQLATEKMARINDAFDRLKKMKNWTVEAAPQWMPGGL